jgi:hypothetical protein
MRLKSSGRLVARRRDDEVDVLIPYLCVVRRVSSHLEVANVVVETCAAGTFGNQRARATAEKRVIARALL